MLNAIKWRTSVLRDIANQLRTSGDGTDVWNRPFIPTASKEDIYYCFRLILGRNPGQREWPWHISKVGSELEAVVQEFLGSQEFSMRGLMIPKAPPTIRIADFPDFKIYASASDALIGQALLRGCYEPDVTAIIRKHLQSGMGVIDIGANVGYFSMLSAAMTGRDGYVLAIEPNPKNIKLMEASRRMNGFHWVTVVPSAAGRRTGVLALWNYDWSHCSNGTTGPIKGGIEELESANLVPCLKVDGIVDPDRRIDLIKIDVEGAEAAALEGARDTLNRWKPLVVSEFSPEAIPGGSGVSAEDYLQFLISFGYHLGVIEPDGSVSHHGQNINSVFEAYRGRGAPHHIDIVARTPA